MIIALWYTTIPQSVCSSCWWIVLLQPAESLFWRLVLKYTDVRWLQSLAPKYDGDTPRKMCFTLNLDVSVVHAEEIICILAMSKRYYKLSKYQLDIYVLSLSAILSIHWSPTFTCSLRRHSNV
jgi:hypothetical protein